MTERSQTLLIELLGMDADARPAFIARECSDDPTLAAEVQALLQKAIEANQYFEGLSEQIGLGVVIPKPPEPGETTIGAYRIERQLGRGGMGAVYLAQRCDEQFEQWVAIKLLPLGMNDGEWRRRFLLERETLARLSHKNICRLFDGGLTEEGAPYFVMEYVDGQRIDAYFASASLSLEEKLILFLDVCAAVQAAHRHLIVHRDLKPSNVFISKDKEVKLLDFGIAKLLDPNAQDQNATGSGLGPMTPRYASPEMLRGEPVTTVTDVYGLGVLLYELLTNTHPQDPTERDRARAANPGARAEPVLASLAAKGPIREALKGDLDQILAKALREDPAERYASVEQFSDDIQNYLAHRPVSASPPAWGYRLKKLYQRRKGLVVFGMMTVLMALTLVGVGVAFTLATVRHSEEITIERDRSERLREVAQQEAMTAARLEKLATKEAAAANRVSEFLVNLFDANIPGQKDKSGLTARALLDQGAKRISEDLKTQPAARARLLETMSRAYEELGLFDDAVKLLERTLAVRRTLAEPAKTGAALTGMARLSWKKGDYRKAKALAEEGVSVIESGDPVDEEQLVRALLQLGWASSELSDLAGAEKHYRRALALQEKIPITKDCDIGATINSLAILSWRRGDSKEASRLYERIIELCAPRWDKNDRRMGHTLNNLAMVHVQANELDRAIATYHRTLKLRRSILDAEHPDIAETLNNLSVAHAKKKDYPAALKTAKRSLEIREKALSPEHTYVATSLTNVGVALNGLGRHKEAAPLFARAMRIFEKQHGAEHNYVSYPLIGLAHVDAATGNRKRADRRFRDGIALRKKGLGDYHPDTRAGLAEYEAFRRSGETSDKPTAIRSE